MHDFPIEINYSIRNPKTFKHEDLKFSSPTSFISMDEIRFLTYDKIMEKLKSKYPHFRKDGILLHSIIYGLGKNFRFF